MNSFKVSKIIKNSGAPMCIDTLSRKCKVIVHHDEVVMSNDLFFCPHCGVNRHYVKKLSLKGRIALLGRKKIIE